MQRNWNAVELKTPSFSLHTYMVMIKDYKTWLMKIHFQFVYWLIFSICEALRKDRNNRIKCLKRSKNKQRSSLFFYQKVSEKCLFHIGRRMSRKYKYKILHTSYVMDAVWKDDSVMRFINLICLHFCLWEYLQTLMQKVFKHLKNILKKDIDRDIYSVSES